MKMKNWIEVEIREAGSGYLIGSKIYQGYSRKSIEDTCRLMTGTFDDRDRQLIWSIAD